MDPSFRIAIFASGSGTNAAEIFSHFKEHDKIKVSLLLSNNPTAYVLERAKKAGVPYKVFGKNELNKGDVLRWLQDYHITHIVLAGFLWLIPKNILDAYPDRIINIHPALLPKYGGKGMYGSKVHEAVKAAGEDETGITIHLVNQNYDEGAIIFQASTSIASTDTPDMIAEKVHGLEHEHYPRIIENWILSA
jgi:phosphoribosylglycinamide formyltransferase-1